MQARKLITQYNGVYLILVVVAAAAFLDNRTFFAFDNVNTMLRQASMLGVVTMGTIFVIATGCVDLSVAAILQMSIGIFMFFVKRLGEGALVYGLLASLAFGVAIGVVNGIIVTRYRVQSFLATLFTAAILGGVMRLVMGVTPLGVPPAALVRAIKGSLIGELSNSVLVFIVVAVAALVLLRTTVWGRKVELIGLNPTAARFAGVDVNRVVTISFGFNGFLAALAGHHGGRRHRVRRPDDPGQRHRDGRARRVGAGRQLPGRRQGVGARRHRRGAGHHPDHQHRHPVRLRHPLPVHREGRAAALRDVRRGVVQPSMRRSPWDRGPRCREAAAGSRYRVRKEEERHEAREGSSGWRSSCWRSSRSWAWCWRPAPRAGRPAKGKKYTIGVSIQGSNNDWASSCYAHFKYAFGTKYADQIANVYYGESGYDDKKQIADIEDLLTKKIDLLIVQPVTETGAAAAIEKAKAAGVKVVIFGGLCGTDKYDAYVDRDHIKTGFQYADWVAKKIDGKGNVVVIMGYPGSGYSNNVLKGVNEALAQYPEIKVLGTEYAMYTPAESKKIIESYFAKRVPIDGVIVDGGLMDFGVLEAFTDAKKPLPPTTADDWFGFLKKTVSLKYTNYMV